MIRKDFRTGLDQTTYTEDNQGMDKTIDVGQDMILYYRGNYRYNTRGNQRYWKWNNNNNRRGNFRNQNYDRNRSRSYERQNRNRRDSRSIRNSRSRSGSRATTNRDRIRCFECREYDHFARDCLTIQANREAGQIQQMFNMDEDQTILQTPLRDVDQDRQIISPVEIRDNSNLYRLGMVPLHFCL